MADMSTDTTTLATDRECVEIEAKARATTVMHWPELVRVINRMRAAEKRCAALTALRDNQQFMLDYVEEHFPEAFAEAEHALAKWDGK